ncbi:SIR2 family protein [Hymenobacter cheonanensis]|uniref:SIR2 family protein n=1 Tax=Hymenobacter sp. CA2-7 TaxID=3063993 RepID=UPI0027136D44|nr:SIR2 family protein [Hymenobacter sp. CA2-7]MDO7884299.1 SIR2 family protein [Hymenobacter sp. CA2-7]
MDKETLFKEIRQGRTLLWAGAGFSRYAGYPMGPGVVEKLYEELSKAQREELAASLQQKKPKCPDWTLPKFAQYFVDLHHGNRTRLIEILDNIFSAEPTRIDVHEKLARLTFINHIVTTNYDPLFELAYRPSRIQVVEQASQIPQIGNKEVALYKIHGQPSNPDSIIITARQVG